MNIINAVLNVEKRLKEGKQFTFRTSNKSKNPINNIGNPAEEFSLDMIADTFDVDDYTRHLRLSEIFPYRGNDSLFPDALSRFEGLEVKKVDIDNIRAEHQFNSSIPKRHITVEDDLSAECRTVLSNLGGTLPVIYVFIVAKGNSCHKVFITEANVFAADEKRVALANKLFREALVAYKPLKDNEFEVDVSGKNVYVHGLDALGLTKKRSRDFLHSLNLYKQFEGYLFDYNRNLEFELNFLLTDESFERYENSSKLNPVSRVISDPITGHRMNVQHVQLRK